MFSTAVTRISGGRFAFNARSSVGSSWAQSTRALATCAIAWTPASVRPAPWTVTARPSIFASASSSSPWIDGPLSCRCQPTNVVPS